MSDDAKGDWDIRDELATTFMAAIFMAAIITGRYANGRDPAVESKAAARTAYDMAKDFLEVRREGVAAE